MNPFLLEQERLLCEEYCCSTIDEVLTKQAEILKSEEGDPYEERRNTTISTSEC